jgi:esterase FrsA
MTADRSLQIAATRARTGRNPFNAFVDREVALTTVEGLASSGSDEWANAFVRLAREESVRAESIADPDERRMSRLRAYDYAHVGRYPGVDGPARAEAYSLAQELHAIATADLPLAVVAHVVFTSLGPVRLLVRRRDYADPTGVLVIGGVDVWKEEAILGVADTHLGRVGTVVAMDAPGTGESPVAMGPGADPLWREVLQWMSTGLGLSRIVVHGVSLGGYWGARAAHLAPELIVGAVDHGGPAHHTFTREWIEEVDRDGNYPFGFGHSLMRTMRIADEERFWAELGTLSLLDAGILDLPHADLLLVNGTRDRTVTFADMELLLSSGGPKSARFVEGADHMGHVAGVAPMIADWVWSRLSAVTG